MQVLENELRANEITILLVDALPSIITAFRVKRPSIEIAIVRQ